MDREKREFRQLKREIKRAGGKRAGSSSSEGWPSTPRRPTRTRLDYGQLRSADLNGFDRRAARPRKRPRRGEADGRGEAIPPTIAGLASLRGRSRAAPPWSARKAASTSRSVVSEANPSTTATSLPRRSTAKTVPAWGRRIASGKASGARRPRPSWSSGTGRTGGRSRGRRPRCPRWSARPGRACRRAPRRRRSGRRPSRRRSACRRGGGAGRRAASRRRRSGPTSAQPSPGSSLPRSTSVGGSGWARYFSGWRICSVDCGGSR